jgi:hypothetical protein
MMAKKFKPSATRIDGGMVEMKLDSKTVVVKKFHESMLEEWPDLAEPVSKPKKRKRVKKDDAEGDAESGTVGNGV